ncbi:hypothetical protein C8J57DRAFT_1162890 [Mycena rebaudengoi]|nr:hypothetical protein C8J57DRAFT_1162890 [Mycena rebaudengoi]
MDAYSLEVTLTDEEWDRYLSHKRRWCEVQPLLESHGYKIPKEYNPDRIVDWQERPAGLVDEPYYPHLLAGTRFSDGRAVMLKFSRVDLYESEIFANLASIPDPDNHTIPLYDVLNLPGHNPEWCIVITPRLTDCRTPHTRYLRDFVNFLHQVLEGICFMHRHNVAHTDIARTNIVWDAKQNPSDPSDLKGKKSKKGPAPSTKYYFIDFGLACSYNSFEDRGLVRGICGQHRDIPELSEEVPYDPFPLDIRQLGEMLNRDYMQVFLGLEFLQPYIARLRDDDPTLRPSAPEALAEFKSIVSMLPEEKMNARLVGRDEWPIGRRILIALAVLWVLGNGMFLWSNWDRMFEPPSMIMNGEKVPLNFNLRGFR